MGADGPARAIPFDAGDDRYGRPADPPPGPRWRPLVGRADLTVALVSLYVIENSGVRLLASILRRRGVRVHEIYFKDWVNNRVERPTAAEVRLLLRQLRAVDPDLVGLSVRASAFHRLATALTERIRRQLDVPVLWGGMHTSSCPDVAAEVADLLCVGEAETAVDELFARLASGGDVLRVPGLWLRDEDGSLVRNDPAPMVQDLDALPLRDFHSPDKVFIDGHRVVPGDPFTGESTYQIMASRGCPFPSCSFCSNSVMDRIAPGQRYYRVRSVGSVLDEVAYAARHFPHLRRVRFDDEEFPVERAWFDEFCDRWAREAALPFEVHMDPRVVTAHRLDRLRAAGLEMVFMGIQATAAVNRSLYARDVSDERVLSAARAIHDSGVRAGYQVILDDPVSTTEDKRALFDLLLQLPRPYELVLFSLAIYPRSALATELLERGVIGPDEIEGPATKVFRQFRVDLGFDRPAEDRFWTALAVLVSKDFVPRELLRRLAERDDLRRHPASLQALAYGANVAKIGQMALELTARGELSWALIRRWASLRALVTF